jgi:hydrogenase expression/formation protein HypD
LAKKNPKKTVVFFAIGFETTAPTTAALLERCLMEGIQNVKVLVNHVLVAPAIEALLKEDGSRIDAFIAPGHVCTITGTAPFEPLASSYQKPFVVSGFEPWDILLGLHNLLGMIANKETGVKIAYTRAVLPQGNPKALSFIERFFDVRESFRWRGLGNIPKSALGLKSEFSAFDAEKAYADVFSADSKSDPEACLCGEVLKGNAKPSECVLFGQACTPQDPVGACMVSSEGACGIYFRYKGRVPA